MSDEQRSRRDSAQPERPDREIDRDPTIENVPAAFERAIGGADFGYADWLGFLSWTALLNLVGGVGLVTTLRLVQVGRSEIESEQAVTEETTINERSRE